MVARKGLVLVAASIATRVLISLALGRVIGSLLWRISATDELARRRPVGRSPR